MTKPSSSPQQGSLRSQVPKDHESHSPAAKMGTGEASTQLVSPKSIGFTFREPENAVNVAKEFGQYRSMLIQRDISQFEATTKVSSGHERSIPKIDEVIDMQDEHVDDANKVQADLNVELPFKGYTLGKSSTSFCSIKDSLKENTTTQREAFDLIGIGSKSTLLKGLKISKTGVYSPLIKFELGKRESSSSDENGNHSLSRIKTPKLYWAKAHQNFVLAPIAIPKLPEPPKVNQEPKKERNW
ncbi:hypothetical protein O181_001767 [Austropuccinia psidii MF-1]|uniref:Uncharacterized protein n=1 Tax=Austropuccinia psidii MF-1 TaxID=1389203 RepID=A0A9Q3BB80_9BASI|nr:hypothetical protein [Austropuccinia psidii MF-1]